MGGIDSFIGERMNQGDLDENMMEKCETNESQTSGVGQKQDGADAKTEVETGVEAEAEAEADEHAQEEALEKLRREREARAQALTLEIVGDLPYAEVKPPENVLFVCKLNPVTEGSAV